MEIRGCTSGRHSPLIKTEERLAVARVKWGSELPWYFCLPCLNLTLDKADDSAREPSSLTWLGPEAFKEKSW